MKASNRALIRFFYAYHEDLSIGAKKKAPYISNKLVR